MKGNKLASGRGVGRMLDVCAKYGYNDENTILVVKNKGDFNSFWTIYDKK